MTSAQRGSTNESAGPPAARVADRSPIITAADYNELQARCERLEQLFLDCQRYASIGDLAAIVFHEINNILTPMVMIGGQAALDPDSERVHKALDHIINSVQRATVFSSRLLQYARTGVPPTDSAPLAEAVDLALGCFRQPYEKARVEFDILVPPELRTLGGAEILAQVIQNLVLYLREPHSTEMGRVVIRAAALGDLAQIVIAGSFQTLGQSMTRAALTEFLNVDTTTPADLSAPGCPPIGMPLAGFGLCAARTIVQRFKGRLSLSGDGNGDGLFGFTIHWPLGGKPATVGARGSDLPKSSSKQRFS